MEKVKLTQEQADGIETWKKTNYRLDDFLTYKEMLDGAFKPLKTLTLDKFARALYIGYEVKEAFKVGDWVITEGYSAKHDGKPLQITKIEVFKGERYYYFKSSERDNDNFVGWRIKRHATPEEITKEKQRRWWKKHNRDVWDLRVGDTLIDKHDIHTTQIKFVEVADETGILLVGGGDHFIQHDIERTLSEEYKVFCFSEDRKDIDS